MTAIQLPLPALRTAVRIGFADLRAVYTWRTWLFGWFARLITQVIFFSLFGLLLGSQAYEDYRAVGNSAAIVCIETVAVVVTVVRERAQGTLSLQVLSPAPFALTYVGRGAYTFVVGVCSSTAAFVIAVALFRVPLAMPDSLLAPLVIVVMGAASYCYGLALGAVVMAQPALQWLVINVGYLSVMTFSGVNVATSYWPQPLRTLSELLPMTHGLEALRTLLDGGGYTTVAADAAAELAVGAGWMVLALAILNRAVWLGRRNGTLDLAAAS